MTPGATSAWLPDDSMGGNVTPSNSSGRVYCGCSSRPVANESPALEAGSMTPGTRRLTASITTSAGQLAAGQDVVPDTHFPVHPGPDSLIHPFVAAADQREPGHAPPTRGRAYRSVAPRRGREGGSGRRRHESGPGRRPAARGAGPSRSPAVRRVVHLPVPSEAVLSQVMQRYGHDPAFHGPAQDPLG